MHFWPLFVTSKVIGAFPDGIPPGRAQCAMRWELSWRWGEVCAPHDHGSIVITTMLHID